VQFLGPFTLGDVGGDQADPGRWAKVVIFNEVVCARRISSFHLRMVGKQEVELPDAPLAMQVRVFRVDGHCAAHQQDLELQKG
jgi:hypothetical protein